MTVSRAARPAFALAVLVLYPLAVLAAAAGAVALTVRLTGNWAVLAPLAAVLLLLAGQGWADLAAARRDAEGEFDAPELSREQHPRLWAEIDRLATALKTDSPERIVAEVEVNAAVTEFTGRREMVLGIPLLAALDVDELRAVIAHELGHYAAGHTGAAGLVHRINRFLDEAAGRLPAGPARALAAGWAWLFGLAATPATTRFEDEADDRAAQLCGPAVTASAMRRTQELDAALAVVIEDYVGISETAGRVAPLREALIGVLGARTDQVRRAVDRPPPRDRLDVHRPLAVRIARMARLGGGAARYTRNGPPAWTLLGPDPADPEALDTVEAALIRQELPRASWPEVLARAGRIGARQDAAALAHSAAAAGVPEPVTLDALLSAAAVGGFPPLLERLAGPGLRGAARSAALQDAGLATLLPAVVWSLLQAGRVRFALDWSRLWHFEVALPTGDEASPGEPPRWADLDLDGAIGAALREPGRVPALRARLAELAVPLDVPLSGNRPEPDEPAVPWGIAPALRLTGSAVPARGFPRRAHLVVCSTGLAFEQSGPGRVTRFRRRAGVERLDELIARVERDPGGLGPGGWLPAAEVSRVTIHAGRPVAGLLLRQLAGWRVTVALAGDLRLQLAPTRETAEQETSQQVLDALFELFAGRVVYPGQPAAAAGDPSEGSSSSR